LKHQSELERLRKRKVPLDLPPDEFREIGHRLVDRLADFLADLPSRAVTPGETAAEVRTAIASSRALPEFGSDAASIVADVAELLIAHSLFNGHPRFFGYITSSATPIGALGDLIASALNCNVGAWKLSPAATEIEAQTIRWIAEFIGYPPECGGLLVSGGNMANFIGLLAARAAAGGMNLRKQGVRAMRPLRCYCSRETHTWIEKAADMAGLGTDSVRWISCDDRYRLDICALRAQVEQDLEQGGQPFLVVGNAGAVSTGAVDPLTELAVFCREYGLWFHVDGAYGGAAAGVPGAPEELKGLALADSVAIDPHKWLYAPIEAGCALVRDPKLLQNTFSYHPSYYNFDTDSINYFDFGPQNSRGFRALKIWLAFQQAGRSGFQQTIADDITLAEHAFQLFSAHPNFETITCNLSVCTFRYIPSTIRTQVGSEDAEALINRLNQTVLGEIEDSGRAFFSNAVVNGKYLLRMCIVNFRTSLEDIEGLPAFIADIGERAFASMQKQSAALV
jgi:glutamate/tyrosine decarboxylase-like PLP-dependent enzyme